jgi:tetratricopeptide (TPR) repeat protein
MRQFVVALCSLAVVTVSAAEDPLTVARGLYASAAYEEALATLDRVEVSARSEQIDEYRVFCLFALGRSAEATSAVDALIARNPLFVPDADASPRIVTLFTSARRRLLPSLIRQRYLAAREELDRHDYEKAIAAFETVQRLIDEASPDAPVDETSLDLRVLVTGFLDLARTSLAAKAAAPAAPAEVQREAPVAAPAAIPAAPAAIPDVAVIEPALGAPAPALPIFTSESEGVVPPVAIRQDLPKFPHDLLWSLREVHQGVIEVLIDTQGHVERVSIREPIHPAYDRLVLAGAKKWTYQAARRDQRPVRFMKTIRIVVNGDSVVSR